MGKTNKRDIPVLVIHHTDADGHCSAAIVDYFEQDCLLHGINHGHNVPWGLIKRARKIYMVDFCFQPFSDMIKARNLVGRENFIWIDHHKTAIQDKSNSGQTFIGLQVIGKAGCELAWDWFTGADCDSSMPKVVRMLGRYDVWDLDHHQDIMPVQFGIKYYNPTAESKLFWKHLFNPEDSEKYYNELKEKGSTCYNYQTAMYTNYCKSHSFDLDWENHRFLCANALHVSSQLFDDKWDHDEYDAMLVFGFTNGVWSCSMYTDKPGIDVGEIAKRYGGGGHKGAAGMSFDKLPFDLQKKRG
jgi:oligoribonuclease NrnB/cAMP/cGMP phosphodiesterase (DHH superfamily)